MHHDFSVLLDACQTVGDALAAWPQFEPLVQAEVNRIAKPEEQSHQALVAMSSDVKDRVAGYSNSAKKPPVVVLGNAGAQV